MVGGSVGNSQGDAVVNLIGGTVGEPVRGSTEDPVEGSVEDYCKVTYKCTAMLPMSVRVAAIATITIYVRKFALV